jgi:hypothetical protein
MVVMVLGAGFWVNFDGAWRVSGGGSQWFVCFCSKCVRPVACGAIYFAGSVYG